MIDCVTAILPCYHSEAITGGIIACISPDGEIEWQVEKNQQVSSSHESNINIKPNGASHLYFDGNPSKWLQAHNLFGSDNFIELVEHVMHCLIPLLRLSPPLSDNDAWKTGRYDLKRLDSTAMWDLPIRADVRLWQKI